MTVILNQNLQSHVEDVAGVKWWSPHCWQRRDWWAVWLNTASVQSVTSWCFRWDWWKSQCYFNNEQREKSSWGSRADCGSVQRMTENNPMSLVILLLEEMLLTFGTKLIGFFFFLQQWLEPALCCYNSWLIVCSLIQYDTLIFWSRFGEILITLFIKYVGVIDVLLS